MIIQTIESVIAIERDREDDVQGRLAAVGFLGCGHGRPS